MDTQRKTDRLPRMEMLRDVVAALPAATAVFLGLFYGLGVLLTTTELIGAHVSVLRALPLIPLQDHLTKGLGAAFSSATLAAFFVVSLCAFIGGYSSSRRMRRRLADFDNSVEAVRREVESLKTDELSEESDRLSVEQSELRAMLESALRSGRDLTEYLELAGDFSRRATAFTQRLEAYKGRSATVDKNLDEMRKRLDAMLDDDTIGRRVVRHSKLILGAQARRPRRHRRLLAADLGRDVGYLGRHGSLPGNNQRRSRPTRCARCGGGCGADRSDHRQRVR